jgi:hypothetical protein
MPFMGNGGHVLFDGCRAASVNVLGLGNGWTAGHRSNIDACRKTRGRPKASCSRPGRLADSRAGSITDVPGFRGTRVIHNPLIFSALCGFLGASSLWLLSRRGFALFWVTSRRPTR